MALVAYVSGHGLGHSAREVTILRDLPPEIPLYVKTAAPDWFWRTNRSGVEGGRFPGAEELGGDVLHRRDDEKGAALGLVNQGRFLCVRWWG